MKNIFFTVALFFATYYTFSQCACCAGAGIGSTNGDFNNGILTLPKNRVVLETYSDFRSIKNGDAPEGEEKLLTSMQINSIGMRYGITDKFTISALLPQVRLFTNNGSDNGIGDLILLGTYNFYQKNSFNFAVQGGFELPTGVQKESTFDNTTIIVGSGSYDPMVGILVSKKWDKLTLNSNVLYKKTNTGFQNNYYGSLSTQSLTLSYRVKGETSICSIEKLDSKSNSNFGLNTNFGYYGEWLDKLTEDGMVDDNSGHYLGLANLGATISYKKWAIPVTFSQPVINKMNGTQNDFGYRYRIGIIRAF
jgi:hypothetical protein